MDRNRRHDLAVAISTAVSGEPRPTLIDYKVADELIEAGWIADPMLPVSARGGSNEES